jgi:hypothetical protein
MISREREKETEREREKEREEGGPWGMKEVKTFKQTWVFSG